MLRALFTVVMMLTTANAPKPSTHAPLPPGAVKLAGRSCQGAVQPPDGQGCPQSSDGGCTGNPELIAECMAARRGWFDGPATGDEWSCIVGVVAPESGFDPTAGYPAGAYGIPQALPGDKMAEAGADWETSPWTQLRWLYDDYLPGTYGTPCAALAFREGHGWY